MLFRHQKNENEKKNKVFAMQFEVDSTVNIAELNTSALDFVGGGSGAYESPCKVGG